MSADHVLALDQGTTSSRAIVFDRGGRPVAVAQQELPQGYPSPGHVTQDPEDIWRSQLTVAREALAATPGGAASIAAVGIANQRETTIVWDRASGAPVAPAIVWQSRITADRCAAHPGAGTRAAHPGPHGAAPGCLLQRAQDRPHPRCIARPAPEGRGGRAVLRDGRQLPPLAPDRRPPARDGRLQRQPDAALRHHRAALGPMALRDDRRAHGDAPSGGTVLRGASARRRPMLLGAPLPIGGVAGDQQAATFGQACLLPGSAKNTYGTGAFALLNTGDRPVASQHGLLSTILWQLGRGRPGGLRPRGLRLRRRGGRPLAAGRAAHHRGQRGRGTSGRRRRPRRRRRGGAGLRRASAPRTGIRMPAARSSA